MPRSEFSTEGSHPDLTTILEQHLRVGFQLDLALDLVLNELVVRAAEATHASSAALALARGDELVCRAATGNFAPDLGLALNPREGLSGVCLRTRQPQLSADTEVDPRIAADFSHRFGIRSVLAVPVFDLVNSGEFTGVLEVFSTAPAAFSQFHQELLEAFAEECSRIRYAALELSQRKPAAEYMMYEPPTPVLTKPVPASDAAAGDAASRVFTEKAAPVPVTPSLPTPVLTKPAPVESEPAASPPHTPVLPPPELAAAEVIPPEFAAIDPLPARGSYYEVWTLGLASLAILAIIGVSFLIGSRVGWLRATESPQSSPPAPAVFRAAAPIKSAVEKEPVPAKSTPQKSARTESKAAAPAKSANAAPASDELVVYEKGKVVFRMKNPPDSASQQPQPDSLQPDADSRAETASATPTPTVPGKNVPATPAKNSSSRSVRLDPAEAENRLLTRIEPEYPPAARAARLAGEVILEVHVAEDGSVASVRTLSGDPLLAAAATRAVHNWRYRPYSVDGRPSQFHTDVTLNFAISN